MLHFTVTMFKICYAWLTPSRATNHVLVITFIFTNRKNEYARCVAYVPGQIGHVSWIICNHTVQ